MRVFAAAVLVSLLVGCGGDSDSSNEDEPLPRDDEARALLLTVDDFPSGWSEEPADDEESPLADECPNAQNEALEGRAESGTFSGGSAEIGENVALFADDEMASDELAAVEEHADCLVDALNDGKLDDDEFEVSDASFSPVSFPDYGDESSAYRLKFRANRRGESGFGNEADAYMDVVGVRIDGTIIQITAFDVLSPYDTDDLQDIVGKAVNKAE